MFGLKVEEVLVGLASEIDRSKKSVSSALQCQDHLKKTIARVAECNDGYTAKVVDS